MTLFAIFIYNRSVLSILYIVLAIIGVIFLLTSIWAIYDLSNRKGITRGEKSSLTFFVVRWPIYGVIVYLLKIRKTLPED